MRTADPSAGGGISSRQRFILHFIILSETKERDDLLGRMNVSGVSPEEEKEGYGGKDLQKRNVLNLE